MKTLPAKSRIRRGKENQGHSETKIIRKEGKMESSGRRSSENYERVGEFSSLVSSESVKYQSLGRISHHFESVKESKAENWLGL
jgi:hypothetical protein